MNIQQIKEKYTCLDYLGDKVVRKNTNGWLARCPWREDAHPSLTVSLNGKGWMDHTTGEHGNLIDLVMKTLNTEDLGRICAEFDSAKPNLFSFDQSKEEESVFRTFSVMPLQSRALYAYLHQRGIDLDIARQYLMEAHYSFYERPDGRYLYALAYQNDLGGYELRSVRFKGSKSPKGITVHLYQDNAPWVIFEGFMDMLSFATLCRKRQCDAKYNYLVLNSVAIVDAGIERLRRVKQPIYLALDNDDAGNKATALMMEQLPMSADIRSRYAPAKDINDFLMSFQVKERTAGRCRISPCIC